MAAATDTPTADPQVAQQTTPPPAAAPPVETMPQGVDKPEEPKRETFMWKGVEYDVTDYDDVRYWQHPKHRMGDVTFCALFSRNEQQADEKGNKAFIPVDNAQEAVEFHQMFERAKGLK